MNGGVVGQAMREWEWAFREQETAQGAEGRAEGGQARVVRQAHHERAAAQVAWQAHNERGAAEA